MWNLTFANIVIKNELHIRQQMWFQQDGASTRASAHYIRAVQNLLNEKSTSIGHKGPITWPPRSSDLMPLDFCGDMSKILCILNLQQLDNIIARITTTLENISPEILRRLFNTPNSVSSSPRSKYWIFIIKNGNTRHTFEFYFIMKLWLRLISLECPYVTYQWICLKKDCYIM